MFPLLQNIRKYAFWLFDAAKGGKVRKHYDDIEFILENYGSPGAQSTIDKYLNQILSHAQTSVPFYKDITPGNISEFPVVNKSIIKENFEDFRSLVYKDKEQYPVVTSGSTGTPFKIYHDRNKKLRNNADTIYFAKRAGFSLGQRLVYIKIWNEINKKNALNAWLQNIAMYDVTTLGDTQIANFIQDIKSEVSAKGFLGYASAYEAICKYLDGIKSNPINCNVKSIIAMSEGLNEYTRQSMRKYFSVPAVSRYSNVENGIIAQQGIDSNEFYINAASYFVELLELNEDIPVKPNESGRIVITDLFNYAMPLIRYDTGDIAIAADDITSSLTVPVFKSVEGRSMDLIYNTTGQLLSSFVVTNTMWKYPELKQYQFIQTGMNTYVFKLNIDTDFERENELVEEFKVSLGADAQISIEYVKEIPLLASGKRKKVMNIYKNHIIG